MFPLVYEKLDLPGPYDRVFWVQDCTLSAHQVLHQCGDTIVELTREVNIGIYRIQLTNRCSELMCVIKDFEALIKEFYDVMKELMLLSATLVQFRNDTSHQISPEDMAKLHVLRRRIQHLELVSRMLSSHIDASFDRLKTLKSKVRNEGKLQNEC